MLYAQTKIEILKLAERKIERVFVVEFFPIQATHAIKNVRAFEENSKSLF